MYGLFRHTTLLIIIASAIACNSPAPSVRSIMDYGPYDDTIYCFNQRSIVHKDGRAGIVDDLGHPILAPEWESIEFLDDEIALLSREGEYLLCTRDGRIYAQSDSAEALEIDYRERLDTAIEDDIRSWDSVLDKLDFLCTDCLRRGRRRPDQLVKEAYSQFQQALSEASGQMTQSQQERFEEIVRRFNTFSGR